MNAYFGCDAHKRYSVFAMMDEQACRPHTRNDLLRFMPAMAPARLGEKNGEFKRRGAN